jgi:hypothetical protein
MPVERYVITERVVIGPDRVTEVTYVDNFDPEQFRSIAYNQENDKDRRHRCAIRLRCAGVITDGEYTELMASIEPEGKE